MSVIMILLSDLTSLGLINLWVDNFLRVFLIINIVHHLYFIFVEFVLYTFPKHGACKHHPFKKTTNTYLIIE
jgi:hypothetical protein